MSTFCSSLTFLDRYLIISRSQIYFNIKGEKIKDYIRDNQKLSRRSLKDERDTSLTNPEGEFNDRSEAMSQGSSDQLQLVSTALDHAVLPLEGFFGREEPADLGFEEADVIKVLLRHILV
jgi:hypothetical protein